MPFHHLFHIMFSTFSGSLLHFLFFTSFHPVILPFRCVVTRCRPLNYVKLCAGSTYNHTHTHTLRTATRRCLEAGCQVTFAGIKVNNCCCLLLLLLLLLPVWLCAVNNAEVAPLTLLPRATHKLFTCTCYAYAPLPPSNQNQLENTHININVGISNALPGIIMYVWLKAANFAH